MQFLTEAVAIARKTLPKDSLRLDQQLAKNCLLLLETKSLAEAEPVVRECLASPETKQPDVRSSFVTRLMLGGTLLGQRTYAEVNRC